MTDKQIVELYFQRSERALKETAAQYGQLFYRISYNILSNHEDAEECVSDTYLTAWETIPPTRPQRLGVFLSKITRRLSIDRWRSNHAEKRGGGELTVAIEELDWALASGDELEEGCMQRELTELLNRFLSRLPDTERDVFICRYWYLDSIKEIAVDFGFTQGKVKSMLMRTRNKLKVYLMEQGGAAL